MASSLNVSLRSSYVGLHSTSSLGLPRSVPAGGLTVCGKFFPEGAILSVPSYTLHRREDVWGDDAEEYRPERWLELDQTVLQKSFNPFSFGPRACVGGSMSNDSHHSRRALTSRDHSSGRNLASMELLVIIASFIRKYDVILEYPRDPVGPPLSVESAFRSADLPPGTARDS